MQAESPTIVQRGDTEMLEVTVIDVPCQLEVQGTIEKQFEFEFEIELDMEEEEVKKLVE